MAKPAENDGHRPMTMRRIWRGALCYTFLGAVIGLGTAWMAAIGVDVADGTYTFGYYPRGSEGWLAAIEQSVGATRIFRVRMSHEAYQEECGQVEAPEDAWAAAVQPLTGEAFTELVPSWSEVRRTPRVMGEREMGPEYSLEDARGWPFLALRCSLDPESRYWKDRINAGRPLPQGAVVQTDRMIWPGADGFTLVIAFAPGDCVRHGILVRPGSKPRVGVGEHQLRLLPLKPIWRGFMANTLFYGLACWCAVMTVRWLRRHRRLLRGCCPECGYPIGTSARCSECGSPLTPLPGKESPG